MAEGALTPLDEHELAGLSSAERAAHYRLACRARVTGDVAVTLAPIVVYSNKIFRACDDHRRAGVPLGLAIDLGSTTVAAFVTTLDEGKVCAGAAALNQQTAFGADVISRLAAAQTRSGNRRARLGAGALLDRAGGGRAQAGAQRSGAHPQGHHRRQLRHAPPAAALSGGHPGRDSFSALQHCSRSFLEDPDITKQQSVGRVANPSYNPFADIFPAGAEVALPPLIGGFVGSDALACLIYYAFDRAPGPMAAIDLGTNGEVMVTDGRRILVGSTAAGPAFEGVNISCGTRAVDGAIIGARVGSRGRQPGADDGRRPAAGRADRVRAAGVGLRAPPGGGHRREGPDRLGAPRLWPTPQLRRGGRAPLPDHRSGRGSPRRRCG